MDAIQNFVKILEHTYTCILKICENFLDKI